MNRSGSFARAVPLLTVCTGLLALPTAAQAVEQGWYMGADVVQLETTLDYGFSETYVTSHARLKAGYQIMDFLSIEGRLMSSDNDTDMDFLGDTYRFETGTMFGIYARPHTNFRYANVYGIVGLTAMNTRYRWIGDVSSDKDLAVVLTFGVGGDFRIVGNMFLNIEAQTYAGTVDYSNYFFDYIDLYGVGLSAGLRFQF